MSARDDPLCLGCNHLSEKQFEEVASMRLFIIYVTNTGSHVAWQESLFGDSFMERIALDWFDAIRKRPDICNKAADYEDSTPDIPLSRKKHVV